MSCVCYHVTGVLLQQLDGPLYSIVQSLLLHTLAQWEEHKLVILRRLLVLAHTRSVSSSLIKKLVLISPFVVKTEVMIMCFFSLSSGQPAEYMVYKPLLILFGIVNGLQKLLKVCFIDVCRMPYNMVTIVYILCRRNPLTLV